MDPVFESILLVCVFLLGELSPLILRDINDQGLLILVILLLLLVIVVACVCVCVCVSLILILLVRNNFFPVVLCVYLTTLYCSFSFSTFCKAEFIGRYFSNLTLS